MYTYHYTILWPTLHYYYLKSVVKEVGKFRGLKIESVQWYTCYKYTANYMASYMYITM